VLSALRHGLEAVSAAKNAEKSADIKKSHRASMTPKAGAPWAASMTPKAGAPWAASMTPKAGARENENHSHSPDNENHSHLNENENHSHLGNFYPRRNTTLIYFFYFLALKNRPTLVCQAACESIKKTGPLQVLIKTGCLRVLIKNV